MNTTSKVIVTAAKTALLSSTLLSLAITALENNFDTGIVSFFFFSIIITFIISFMMILATIIPFNELRPDLSLEQKFKRYFPFIAITFFLGCFCIIYFTNFEPYIIALLGTIYISAMQSWVWFFKQKNTIKNEDN